MSIRSTLVRFARTAIHVSVVLFVLAQRPPLFAQGTKRAKEIAADLQRAQVYLKENNQAAADELFRAVLLLDPNNVEAHANLGVIAFFQNNCPVAVEQLKAALISAPKLAKTRALLAVCERRQSDPAAAGDLQESFDTLQDPVLRTQVGIQLADLVYEHGDLLRCAGILQTLTTFSPDNVDVLFFAQRVYSELSEGTLNKLAVLAPDSARMQQLIAERLINGGDLKDAIVHYQKALELNPHLPGMHLELAESLMESSPNDAEMQRQALAELEAAADNDGDSAKLECLRGHIASLQSKQDLAVTHYRKALSLAPGDPQAEIGLADLLKQQHQPEEAATYLRSAISVDPMNAEAHYKLSQLDRQLHLEDEQKRELKLFQDIRAARDKVRQLYREMNTPLAPISIDSVLLPPAGRP